MKNWKTSGSGILALLTIIWRCVSTKTVGPEDVAGATVAIGLIVAKDSNVTGGTVEQ